jgi:beta-aspartyl-peptidase (threonine type)
MPKAILLIHAGAGQVRETIAKNDEIKSREALNNALQAGYKILKNGGSSIDAVEAAIKIMEDFPLFNAGKGAVISNSGECELDASIMEGKDKKAYFCCQNNYANTIRFTLRCRSQYICPRK